MSRRSVAPIQYDESALTALSACRTYLEEAAAYVQGEKDSLPDPAPLTTARFPRTSILKANALEGTKDFRWPTIAAKIEDRKATSDRYFDPWYFVVMLLMEIPGGRFVYDRSKGGKYFYAAYAGSNAKENFYLRRIIVNTPIWADTREGKHRGETHYDYRRPTLHWIFKDVVRTLGQETRSVSSNREGAIRFAVGLFKQQLAAHHGSRRPTNKSKLPGLALTAAEYEKLLGIALHIADAMHEKYLLVRASESAK